MFEIEDLVNDLKSSNLNKLFKKKDTIIQFLKFICEKNPTTQKEFQNYYRLAMKTFKIVPSKATLIYHYRKYFEKKNNIEPWLVRKLGKSSSGVNVITVLTSPYPVYKKNNKIVRQAFSCGNNCAYCPKEPKKIIDMIVVNYQQKHVYYENKKYCYIQLQSNKDIDELRVISWIVIKDKSIPVFKLDKIDIKLKTLCIYIPIKFKTLIVKGMIIQCIKNEQPRSYISSEPAVQRANRYNFSAEGQFFDRAFALKNCGHLVDKIELLILGGTWSHYPKEYQIEFIRDIYFSANQFYLSRSRQKKTLQEEININQNKSQCKIIGITIETRPDCITLSEIKHLRELSCTRVQLGIQHIDDDVLFRIQRKCYYKHSKKAIYLLKQNGFKIDIHLMPDLPSSSYKKDKLMFQSLLGYQSQIKIKQNHIQYKMINPDIQADQWKIYPTSVTKWTRLFEWHKMGIYKSYANQIDLITHNTLMEELLLQVKQNMLPWIRLNRIIRDIPSHEIHGGNNMPSLRQILQKKLKEKGHVCRCIRCREIKTNNFSIKDAMIKIRQYNASHGTEYFISFEHKLNNRIFGFLRLRFNHQSKSIIYHSLHDSAIVRELHVYGCLITHDNKQLKLSSSQHKGIGTLLLQKAEEITQKHKLSKIAIISGVGVRNYYKKRGYHLQDTYMIKSLSRENIKLKYYIFLIVFCILLKLIYLNIFLK